MGLKKFFKSVVSGAKKLIKAAVPIALAYFTGGMSLAITTGLSVLLSKSPKDPGGGGGGGGSADALGTRVQLPPATQNKLPVSYGTAWVAGVITDAKISTDNQTMWYCLTLSETTSGTHSFDRSNIYFGDKKLAFDGTDQTRVVSWTNSAGQTVSTVNGKMFVYLYNNGSGSPTAGTSGTAIDIMSNSAIAEANRWNGPNYTAGGATAAMTNTVFAIVKITYDPNVPLTNMEPMKFLMTNTLIKPGEVINDYLQNARYGVGLTVAEVNTASLTELDAYSDELITYTPAGGGAAQTKTRYRINGVLDTNKNVMTNLLDLTDCADSWLQWNEITGQWGVIINRAVNLTTAPVVTSDQIIGGVSINPLDLNSCPNSIEAAYFDINIRDQANYYYEALTQAQRHLNEPDNKLSISFQYINDYVRAQYISRRRIKQGREDLAIQFTMDYSGIQLTAGDVIGVNHETYGWGPTAQNPTQSPKYFRISQLNEKLDAEAGLSVAITAFEYNEEIYDNGALADFVPLSNSGVSDPSVIGAPGQITFTNAITTSAIPFFLVNTAAPTVTANVGGFTTGMEFWYANTANANISSSSFTLYNVQTPNQGPYFTPGGAVSQPVTGLPQGTYTWYSRAVNQSAKSSFSSPATYTWNPNPTGTVTGQNFQAAFTPPFQVIQRNANLVPQLASLGNIELYGLSGAAQINFVDAQTDSAGSFVANTWRVGGSSTTGYADITKNNITIANCTDGGTFATFPAPTAVGSQPISMLVPVRYKDGANVIYQSPPARIDYYFSDAGANGVAGSSGVTISSPRIYFLAPDTANIGNISVSGGSWSVGTQQFTSNPTVLVNGSNTTFSTSAVSVAQGTLRYVATANTYVSNNILDVYNIGNNWQTPQIDGGFGPRGQDGTNPYDFTLNVASAAFYLDGSVYSPGSLPVSATFSNWTIGGDYRWQITAGLADLNGTTFGAVPQNGTIPGVTVVPRTGSVNAIVLLLTTDAGFSKSLTIPIVARGQQGPAGGAGLPGPSGTRGLIPMLYVPMTIDPTTATDTQKTTAWLAASGNLNPIDFDGATFYGPNNSNAIQRYNSVTTPRWQTVTGLTVPGDIIASGTIQAAKLVTNSVLTNGVRSTNATVGDNNSVGFWLDSTNGDARFAGSVSIGENLTVGQLISASTLNAGVVTSTNIQRESVSRIQVGNTNGSFQVVTFSSSPGNWPNNTRYIVPLSGASQEIIPRASPSTGARIELDFTVQIYSATNDSYNLVELWVDRADNFYNQNIRAFAAPYFGRTDNLLWAAGANGVYLVSTNGGQNWTQVNAQTTLDEIRFIYNESANPFLGSTRFTLVAATTLGEICYASYYTPVPPQNYNNTGLSQIYTGTNAFNGGVQVVNSANIPYSTQWVTADSGIIRRGQGGYFVIETTGTNNDLKAVAANTPTQNTNYRLVAVGSLSTILTSDRSGQGVQTAVWTARTSPTISNYSGVAYGNGVWVAVGSGGVIITSSDGSTWAQRTSNIFDNINAVAYGNGRWIAVGNNLQILTSTDNGVTWTSVSPPSISGSRNLYAVTYHLASGRWNIGGDACVFNSSSGTSWTVAVDLGASQVSTRSRLWFQGSNVDQNSTAQPPVNQRIVNNSVVTGALSDVGFTQNAKVTYYLVVGNLAGTKPYYTNPRLTIREVLK